MRTIQRLCIAIALLIGVAAPSQANVFFPDASPKCTFAAGDDQLSIAGDDTRTCGVREQGATASVTDAAGAADCLDIEGAVGGGDESLFLQWDDSIGAAGEWKCPAAGAAAGSILVRSEDGSFSESATATLRFTDGSLTLNGAGDVSIALDGIIRTVVGSLPGSPSSIFEFIVTDGQSAIDCSVGGATGSSAYTVLCAWHVATGWRSIGVTDLEDLPQDGATNEQVITWNQAAAEWQPQTIEFLRRTVIGSLPGTPLSVDETYVVLDGATKDDCSVGQAGAPGNLVHCVWDADNSLWVAAGDGPGPIPDIRANVISGMITGGTITINADPTTFDLAAGTGVMVDWSDPSDPVLTPVEWDAQLAVAVDKLLTDLFTAVSIDENGDVQQISAASTPTTRRTEISLASIVHETMSQITSVTTDITPAYDVTQAVLDWIFTVGAINTGNGYVANGANLQIDKVAGVTTLPFINQGINPLDPTNKTDVAQTAISNMVQNYQDGLGGVVTVPSQSAIDPSLWDDGSGILQTLPAADPFQIFRFWFCSQNGQTVFANGQATYKTIDDARAAIFTEDFTQSNPFLSLCRRPTVLIVKRDATDLTDPTKAEFVTVEMGLTGSGSFAPNPSVPVDHVNFTAEVDAQVTAASSTGEILFNLGDIPTGSPDHTVSGGFISSIGFLAADGTASTPGISFVGATNTGLYRSGGEVHLTEAGVGKGELATIPAGGGSLVNRCAFYTTGPVLAFDDDCQFVSGAPSTFTIVGNIIADSISTTDNAPFNGFLLFNNPAGFTPDVTASSGDLKLFVDPVRTEDSVWYANDLDEVFEIVKFDSSGRLERCYTSTWKAVDDTLFDNWCIKANGQMQAGNQIQLWKEAVSSATTDLTAYNVFRVVPVVTSTGAGTEQFQSQFRSLGNGISIQARIALVNDEPTHFFEHDSGSAGIRLYDGITTAASFLEIIPGGDDITVSAPGVSGIMGLDNGHIDHNTATSYTIPSDEVRSDVHGFDTASTVAITMPAGTENSNFCVHNVKTGAMNLEPGVSDKILLPGSQGSTGQNVVATGVIGDMLCLRHLGGTKGWVTEIVIGSWALVP